MVAEDSIKMTEENQTGEQTEEKEMTREEKIKEAEQLFSQGKRHFLSNNLPDASSSLADACKLFVEVYGVFGTECFEPHFQYGKTLLDLGRLEPGVFTNALQGVDEGDEDTEDGEEDGEVEDEEKETVEADSTEQKTEEKTEPTETKEDDEQFESADKLTAEEREELHEAVEDALDENAELLAEGKDPAVEEPEAEGAEGADETEADEQVAQEDDEGEEVEEMEAESATEEDEEDPDQISNLQLAFEILDVARVICEKQETKEWKLRLLDVLLVLAEVSIEDERYEKAQEDLENCIKMQKELLPADDRTLAESYFQLGRLFNFIGKYNESAEQYKLSLAVLESHLANSKEKLAKCEDDDEKKKLEKDVSQVEALIPDIQAKVDDSVESQKTVDLRKEQEAEATSTETTDLANDDSEKPAAKDISNLVRKPIKRKEEAAAEEQDAKRAKPEKENEELTNGNAAEGTEAKTEATNGHSVVAPEEVQG